MLANVHCNKEHIEETISTLKFATRMMKVKNEAMVNSVVDPSLQIKRLEKEIRDLKQELAMHDTLANRGRVNYDEYSKEESAKIRDTTVNFLEAAEYIDIENIDSLRMIREVFGCIKTEYKRQEQKIASIKRQIAEDPSKFKQYMEEKVEEEVKAEEVPPATEAKPEEGDDGEKSQAEKSEAPS